MAQPAAGRLDILEFAPCFVAGILCYKLSQVVRPRLPFALWPVLVPALMLLCLLSSNPDHWPVAWIICLLTALIAPFIKQSRVGIVRSVSHWIARYSFGIYLTHYFCLWLAFRANRLPWPVQGTIFVLALVLLPVTLYRLIESPMIRLGKGSWSIRAPILPAAALAPRSGDD
jgi:peptidoglycan/LPS O-acetylase OafA/YrhL